MKARDQRLEVLTSFTKGINRLAYWTQIRVWKI